MPAPLSGLRVVEGSAFVAAPLCGLTLAQLGADVIRFDRIGGGIDFSRWPLTPDGVSLYWAGLNKGKRSVALDLGRPEGRELAVGLATAPGDGAGLFVSNFPESGWLADAVLRARRADLIYVSIMGNPDGGTAIDYTVNAASGIAYATGPEGSTDPLNNTVPAWDIATGLYAAIALVAAERERRATGDGGLVRISLADVAFTMVANLGLLGQAQLLHENRPPLGNHLYGAFGRDFATRDGRRVMVAAISLAQWRALLAATGTAARMDAVGAERGEDLSDEGARFRCRDGIGGVLAPWFAARTLDEVRAELDENGACWGPYQHFTQLLEDDPRASPANPVFAEVEHPGIGALLTPSAPMLLPDGPPVPPAPAPLLGAHTDEVLAEVLGLSDAEIGRLHDQGLVATAVEPD